MYREASLYDERRFKEWLALLTEDVRYFMPMLRNVKFGEHEREETREMEDLNWIDEGIDTGPIVYQKYVNFDEKELQCLINPR